MRRSRSALFLFLATFSASLFAVGLADGRHQSSGRCSNFYECELDEVDCWLTGSAPVCREREAAASCQPATAVQALPGSTGWLVLAMPPSPLGLILYIDDETACCLSCPGAFEIDDVAASDAASALAADFARLIEIDSASPSDAALAMAARFADPLIASLVWPMAVEAETARIAAWTECHDFAAYPDCSLAGWLGETRLWATAELWRSVGRGAFAVAEQFIHGYDLATNRVSHEIAGWLVMPAEVAKQARSQSVQSGPRRLPKIGHVGVPFLTL